MSLQIASQKQVAELGKQVADLKVQCKAYKVLFSSMVSSLNIDKEIELLQKQPYSQEDIVLRPKVISFLKNLKR